MFPTDLLQAFVSVVDCGGFTRAAHRLHATQSTISGKLKRLEAQTGKRLLKRSTRGDIALTPAGELLLGYARDILRLQEAASHHLRAAPLAGPVRLGMSDDYASGRALTTTLAHFAQLHPQVRLDIQVGNSEQLLTQVQAGELDFALAKRHGNDGSGERLKRVGVVWVTAAGGRPITQAALAPLRLVLFPAPCAYRELALKALQRAGRRWEICYTSPSLAGIRSALAAGLGVAPLARDLLDGSLQTADSEYRLPRLGSIECILHQRQGSLEPAARALGELLRGHWRD